ncbi:MAG: hypothetical protein HY898_24510 [Deltaproteobacteria bacterium]|nr:hypothetical protein [Deltaproteobacteria bacterium]
MYLCFRRLYPLVALAGLTACSSSSRAPAIESTLPDASTEAAAGSAGSPADASPWDASEEPGQESGLLDALADAPSDTAGSAIGATHGVATFPFQVDSTGEGKVRLEALSVVKNKGTLKLAGAGHTGIAYQSHAWGGAGYNLYDILSIADDGSDLAVTYLYCQEPALSYAYTESFQLPMSWETAAGTCESLAQSTSAQVDLPALKAAPVALDTGIVIQGTDVDLGPKGGTIKLAGTDWTLVPFNTVDCTQQCPGGSWIELHSMLMSGDQGCFAILYLWPDDPTKLQVAYTLCLPTLETPTAIYTVSWTGTLPKLPPMPAPFRPAPPAMDGVSELH